MGLISRLATDEGIETFLFGNQELVGSADARRFVEVCRKQRIRIIGIEGFALADETLLPIPRLIADLSGNAGPSRSADVADDSFADLEQDPSVVFEFVLDDHG